MYKRVRVRALSGDEKAQIAAACERFLARTFKPRQWWRLHSSVALDDALLLIKIEPLLQALR
jgi:hypothetical protein